jgi:hypothetical protein
VYAWKDGGRNHATPVPEVVDLDVEEEYEDNPTMKNGELFFRKMTCRPYYAGDWIKGGFESCRTL